MISWLRVLGLLLCGLVATAAAQDEGMLGGPNAFTDRGLLVWYGTAAPALPELTGLIAPVLWFSPDEPLLLNGGRLPHPHPCDPAADDPVAY